jgi:multimeric flavodoxin WrbA
MNCLIINTLSKTDEKSHAIINSLSAKIHDAEIFDANDYKIGACIGCTNCWLKHPGVCAIKDDWEILFKKFLKSDCIVFVTEAKLGFFSHKLKNLIDRLIPLGTPYTIVHQGEARHKPRYKKSWNMGLLYTGNGNKDFLNEWMKRLTLNFFSKSLGVFNIDESEDLYHEIDNL